MRAVPGKRGRPAVSERLPPVHLLQVFDAAARHLSFKAAAQELFVTPSAVSHQIRALEEHLGAPLFERLNRRIALTPAGEHYAQFVGNAFAVLRDGHAGYRVRHGQSRLRLSVAAYFASEFVLPFLPDFQERYPDIELTIETGVHMARIEEGEADIGIRFGDGRWAGLDAEFLFPCEMTPVCAPKLAKTLARKGPEALADVPLIQPEPTPQAWAMWAKFAGIDLPEAERGLRLDSYLAVMQAAERGLGVAPGLVPLVDGWLERGRVARPWAQSMPLGLGYWFVCRRSDRRRPEIRRFRAWVHQTFRQAGLIIDEPDSTEQVA